MSRTLAGAPAEFEKAAAEVAPTLSELLAASPMALYLIRALPPMRKHSSAVHCIHCKPDIK